MDESANPRRVLVVDDEPQILKVMQAYLEQAGYQVTVAADGPAGLAAFRMARPDLVILDLNLPVMDGLEVCRAIRRESAAPVLMLTARVEEADRLAGLELGADDYVIKPFSPREVVARVRAILRRTEHSGAPPEQPEVLQAGELTIDLPGRSVTRAGRPVELTPTEFDILAALAGQPRRVFTRSQIADTLQGGAFEGYERTIDVHIKNLRNKLEATPRRPHYIHTVFGVGYKFDPPPEE